MEKGERFPKGRQSSVNVLFLRFADRANFGGNILPFIHARTYVVVPTLFFIFLMSIKLTGCPTDPFIRFKPQNQGIHGLYVEQKRRSTDFEAQKLRRGRSGGCHTVNDLQLDLQPLVQVSILKRLKQVKSCNFPFLPSFIIQSGVISKKELSVYETMLAPCLSVFFFNQRLYCCQCQNMNPAPLVYTIIECVSM